MIEPLSNYYEIKIKYVDLLTKLNYTDTAFLRTRYPTVQNKTSVNRPSIIDYTTVVIIITIFSLALILIIIFLVKSGSKNEEKFGKQVSFEALRLRLSKR